MRYRLLVCSLAPIYIGKGIEYFYLIVPCTKGGDSLKRYKIGSILLHVTAAINLFDKDLSIISKEIFQDETLAAIIDLQTGVVVDKVAFKIDSLRDLNTNGQRREEPWSSRQPFTSE